MDLHTEKWLLQHGHSRISSILGVTGGETEVSMLGRLAGHIIIDASPAGIVLLNLCILLPLLAATMNGLDSSLVNGRVTIYLPFNLCSFRFLRPSNFTLMAKIL